MQIGIYNGKGGMGKSTVAMILQRETGATVVTNDTKTRWEKVLPEEKYIKVDEQAAIEPTVSGDVIYDLGGFYTDHVVACLARCDAVIVPFRIGNTNDWDTSAETLLDVQKALPDNNIIALHLRDLAEDPEAVESAVKSYFPELTLLAIPRAKLFKEILGSGIGISDRIKQLKEAGNKGLATQMKRRLGKPINALLSAIEEMK